MSKNHCQNSPYAADSRTMQFFREHQLEVCERTDRLFAVLLPLQWAAAIFVACLISPFLWTEVQPDKLVNVNTAIFVGGGIICFPTILTIISPGKIYTRLAVAVGQMLLSGLIIHLTAGRIESHFHIFGSLAFLSFYRDWRILIPATIVTGADHLIRGYIYPFSIYGILTGGELRWIEHLGWIIFEDAILIYSIRRTVFKMRQNASRNAAVEAKEEKYRAVVEQTNDGIALIEPSNLRIIECNEAFSRLLGCASIEDAKTLETHNLKCENDWLLKNKLIEKSGFKSLVNSDKVLLRRDGTTMPVETTINLISYAGREVYCVNLKDITERKLAEAELSLLAIVAQKTQNAVVITDDQGIIQWVNEAFTTLTGYN